MFDRLDEAVVSTVNVAEVDTYAVMKDLPTEAIDAFFADTGITMISFDPVQAVAAGQLASITRQAGLSLGDRGCLALALALAQLRNAEVLTAN